jgi:hypothetical protein
VNEKDWQGAEGELLQEPQRVGEQPLEQERSQRDVGSDFEAEGCGCTVTESAEDVVVRCGMVKMSLSKTEAVVTSLSYRYLESGVF